MGLDRRIYDAVESLLQGSEYEVVDVECTGEPKGFTVRIFLDKPGGVDLTDCTRLSRAFDDHFEAESLMPGKYILEVSSPGIDRPVRKPKDFEAFAGEQIRITTVERIEGRNKHRGTLAGFDTGTEEVKLETDDGVLSIPLHTVKKARLNRDPWEYAKRMSRSSTEEDRK